MNFLMCQGRNGRDGRQVRGGHDTRGGSSMRRVFGWAIPMLVVAAMAVVGAGPASAQARPGRYQDLLSLFSEWRAFQQPKTMRGAPDYSTVAMAVQQRALAGWKKRLASLDTTGWNVPQQVDYHVVRAEMNGLDFDHRVLRPWANNPGFYVTVFSDQSDQPAREGPFAAGAVEVWSYSFPLSAADAEKVDAGVRAIPELLQQARRNLVGNQRDIWVYGITSIRSQSADLLQLAARLTTSQATLRENVDRAIAATDAFATWLEARAPSKTGKSGIGVANYDWYLRNVQLTPFTWRDEVTLMERELARSSALLALEELRNAGLPAQQIIGSAEEHGRRVAEGVTNYMKFLREREILTVRDWMDAALRVRVGSYSAGPREFFGEVDYRDPQVMRTHGYHWFDLGHMIHNPHPSPIRRGPLLYNIFVTRTEGNATGWEEMMMQAGMFDANPRSRELVYILLAERAARALGDLRMQSNELTLEQASQFASDNTPRGWLSMKGNLVRGEQHLYLQQPGYGTSYVIGKLMLDQTLMIRKRQLGDRFNMRQYMDAFDAVGLVPASLVQWELTGELAPEVRRMLSAK